MVDEWRFEVLHPLPLLALLVIHELPSWCCVWTACSFAAWDSFELVIVCDVGLCLFEFNAQLPLV
jgi:hypothetical protein